MSEEIIYTSAPRGLRHGSHGFCTVASTSGMAKSLADRLESLSGYRHVFPPDHDSARENPVVQSHLILKIGGQICHVLSRIADAGFDYSQRTNKIAHHVALLSRELVAPGPAWVLAQPGFSETTWQGEPRTIDVGRQLPRGVLPTRACEAWQRVTGDSGWAGVLAQHAISGTRPAYLVFAPGTDMLPLLVEAQSLLPESKRWGVSFSTYFTRLPPGVECHWRCVVAGSPEAMTAANLRGDLIIDLTRPLASPAESPLVIAARTGELSMEASNIVSSSAVQHKARLPKAVMPPDFPTNSAELRLGPPALLTPSKPIQGPPPLASHGARRFRSSTAAKRIIFVGGLALTTIVIIALAGVGISRTSLSDLLVQVRSSNTAALPPIDPTNKSTVNGNSEQNDDSTGSKPDDKSRPSEGSDSSLPPSPGDAPQTDDAIRDSKTPEKERTDAMPPEPMVVTGSHSTINPSRQNIEAKIETVDAPTDPTPTSAAVTPGIGPPMSDGAWGEEYKIIDQITSEDFEKMRLVGGEFQSGIHCSLGEVEKQTRPVKLTCEDFGFNNEVIGEFTHRTSTLSFKWKRHEKQPIDKFAQLFSYTAIRLPKGPCLPLSNESTPVSLRFRQYTGRAQFGNSELAKAINLSLHQPARATLFIGGEEISLTKLPSGPNTKDTKECLLISDSGSDSGIGVRLTLRSEDDSNVINAEFVFGDSQGKIAGQELNDPRLWPSKLADLIEKVEKQKQKKEGASKRLDMEEKPLEKDSIRKQLAMLEDELKKMESNLKKFKAGDTIEEYKATFIPRPFQNEEAQKWVLKLRKIESDKLELKLWYVRRIFDEIEKNEYEVPIPFKRPPLVLEE